MWQTFQTRRPDPASPQDKQGQKRSRYSRQLYVGAHVLPYENAYAKPLLRPDSEISPTTATYRVDVENLRPDYLIFRLFANSELVAEVDYCNRRKLICNFQTHPAQRGKGWGRILLQTALRHPVIQTNTVILNARPYGNLKNALAQKKLEAFYSSFGFEPTGRISLKGTEMRLSPFRRRIYAFLADIV